MNRFTSFLAGAVVAAGVGYYKLHQDVWKTARIVEEEVRQSRDLLRHQNVDLDKRVSELQQRMTEMQQGERELFTHIKLLHQRMDQELSALREEKSREERSRESKPKSEEKKDVSQPQPPQVNEKQEEKKA